MAFWNKKDLTIPPDTSKDVEIAEAAKAAVKEFNRVLLAARLAGLNLNATHGYGYGHTQIHSPISLDIYRHIAVRL